MPTGFRVCDSSPSVLLDINAACQPQDVSKQAPIDDYYDAAESITLVGTQELLSQHAVLGRLLLLGHVGATENFVRSILVKLLYVCPLCRTCAGTQAIPFASVQYYDASEIGYGLFDGSSLAGGADIRRAVKKVTGLDVPNKGPLHAALGRFNELCELRHAAVHAHGSIGTSNATVLGLVNAGKRLSLSIDLARTHESAMVCRAFVQELNQHLFEAVFAKWRDTGLIVRDYSIDRPNFVPLYALFRSMRDGTSKLIAPKTAYETLLR